MVTAVSRRAIAILATELRWSWVGRCVSEGDIDVVMTVCLLRYLAQRTWVIQLKTAEYEIETPCLRDIHIYNIHTHTPFIESTSNSTHRPIDTIRLVHKDDAESIRDALRRHGLSLLEIRAAETEESTWPEARSVHEPRQKLRRRAS